ncbi:hypothetical protein BC833DRAFT_620598 [Globomyces pollinis-pini]|nr:hypothetical protein BC833DRAFT_620598 [Globomyces pollinis-pini]
MMLFQPLFKILLFGISFANQNAPYIDLDLTEFPFQTFLSENFTLHWEITNKGTKNQEFYAALEYNGDINPSKQQWFGIGFGKTMLDANFIVCQSNNRAYVTIGQYRSQSGYSQPVLDESDTILLTPVAGFISSKVGNCVFKKTMEDLNLSLNINLIWAFNMESTSDFGYHGLNHGFVSLNANTGSSNREDVNLITKKKIHGFGMMIVWLFVFPFGSFYARYLRFTHGWIIVKVTVSVAGVMGMLVCIFMVMTNGKTTMGIHSIIGFALIGMILFQVLMGFYSLLGMLLHSMEKRRQVIRLLHRVTAGCMVLVALVQVPIGINTLFPLKDSGSTQIWYLYFIAIAFWVVAFSTGELFFRYYVHNEDAGYSTLARDSVGIFPSNIKNLEELPLYTWETITEAVKEGKLLVVSNGRYVYDISRWINSHPGGRLILQSAIGTDITNDFFHLSGYDAEEFIAQPDMRKKSQERAITIDPLSQNKDNENRMRMMSNSIASVRNPEVESSHFTQNEWACILSARRTHVHTKLAVKRLCELIVGEIPSSALGVTNSTNTLSGNLIARFDPEEYRRYTITNIEAISSDTVLNRIVKFTFCLLYPFDMRAEQPSNFIPGQYLKLQLYLDGQYVTIEVIPIKGNLMKFETLIKHAPGDPLSDFLLNQLPGQRQVKICGPFGESIIHHATGNKSNQSNNALDITDYDSVYYFTSGIRIATFLQFIDCLLLPVNTVLQATCACTPKLTDELTISIGDVVLPMKQFYDGWAYGLNLTTNQKGIFPMGCLQVFTMTKFILVNFSDNLSVVGDEIVNGVCKAYPSSIHVSSIYENSLDPETIRPFLINNPCNRKKVFVNAPSSLSSNIVDLLNFYASEWDVNPADIVILNQ